MDKSAIDTPSREIDLRNIPVHLRTALRRALEFEARAPAPRSAEEAEQCEEQLRAIADEFFGALLTPVLAIRRVINLRIKGASIYWLPESVDAILLLRSFYKSGRWNCLQRMAMTPVGVSA